VRVRALAAVTIVAALALLGCDRPRPQPRPAPPPAPRTLDETSIVDHARDVDAARTKLRYIALFSPT
jgi:hypothetical protein